MTHPYLVDGNPKVLAHRGASARHPPGNTFEAFDAALAAGADHIETDVHATSDGAVVVFHDDVLDDATTCEGTIAQYTWRELSSCRYFVDGQMTETGLVLLGDVLERYPDAYFNIDAKTDDVVEPLAELLHARDMRDRVCVASFGLRRLRRLRRSLGPGWCSALSQPEIVTIRVLSWLRIPLPRLGDAVQLPRTFKGITATDRRLVNACHDAEIAVHVWTVDDEQEMRRLFEMGCDAVITNRPDIAVSIAP